MEQTALDESRPSLTVSATDSFRTSSEYSQHSPVGPHVSLANTPGRRSRMSAQGSDRPDLPTSSFRDALDHSVYPDGSHISPRTARVDPPILEEKSEAEEEEKKHSPTHTNLLDEPGVFCAQRASAQDTVTAQNLLRAQQPTWQRGSSRARSPLPFWERTRAGVGMSSRNRRVFP